jgi:hypothetical protein
MRKCAKGTPAIRYSFVASPTKESAVPNGETIFPNLINPSARWYLPYIAL